MEKGSFGWPDQIQSKIFEGIENPKDCIARIEVIVEKVRILREHERYLKIWEKKKHPLDKI